MHGGLPTVIAQSLSSFLPSPFFFPSQNVFLAHNETVFKYISTLESLLFTSDVDPHILEVFQQFCALRAWFGARGVACKLEWANSLLRDLLRFDRDEVTLLPGVRCYRRWMLLFLVHTKLQLRRERTRSCVFLGTFPPFKNKWFLRFSFDFEFGSCLDLWNFSPVFPPDRLLPISRAEEGEWLISS